MPPPPPGGNRGAGRPGRGERLTPLQRRPAWPRKATGSLRPRPRRAVGTRERFLANEAACCGSGPNVAIRSRAVAGLGFVVECQSQLEQGGQQILVRSGQWRPLSCK